MKVPAASVRILRIEESDDGTFGVLQVNTRTICFTLERPDLLNRPFESSIPAQQYGCKRFLSPTHGETFKVEYVPSRNDILFHSGNTALDTTGCILLGRMLGELNGRRAVLSSKEAFRSFMQALENVNEFRLTISEHYG